MPPPGPGACAPGGFKEREGTGASRRSGKRRPQWDRALAGLDAGETFRTLLYGNSPVRTGEGWAALDGQSADHEAGYVRCRRDGAARD